MKIRSFLTATALFTAIFASLGSSQTITGSLEGKVSDKSGAVVPNANVRAVNRKAVFSRPNVTNGWGEYRLLISPVANYRVPLQASSSRPQAATVQLTIEKTATLDFTLEPSSVKEEVTVTAEAPLI